MGKVRGLKTGLVGMPNVGKSTLFNALTGSEAARAENFPFCTIEPNHGHALVHDERLEALHKQTGSRRIVPSRLEFVDIAGLVSGASKGEGLGNQFLANIRACDAIVHLVRGFVDPEVTHVEGDVDPLRDIALINLELCLADMAQIDKRMPKAKRKGAQSAEVAALTKLRLVLDAGRQARQCELAEEEEESIRQLQLLTRKPMIYAVNVSEDDFAGGNDMVAAVRALALEEGAGVVVVSAQIESELVALEEEERASFLADLGLAQDQVGLRQLVRESYELLQLQTYFTSGEQETRAWCIPRGATAPEAAAVIHSDFEKGFIRADTINWQELLGECQRFLLVADGRVCCGACEALTAHRRGCWGRGFPLTQTFCAELTPHSAFTVAGFCCAVEVGGMRQAREKGVLRSEGREYVVQDGDVMNFRTRT